MSSPYVIPDIQPYRDNSGVMIEGRAQLRDHLRRNDLVEMGHSDIAYLQSEREKKNQAAADRMQKMQSEVIGKWEETEPIPEDAAAKKRLWCKVAERLEGRATPSRKQLIRIVLEELKREKRNG